MASVASIVAAMRHAPANVRFTDLRKVCEHYFGEPRQSGGSHMVFRTPWRGDPRVNIQSDRGKGENVSGSASVAGDRPVGGW